VLLKLAKNQCKFLAAEAPSCAHFVREPFFRNAASVDFAIQEEIERAVVPSHYLHDAICILPRVFSSMAHALALDSRGSLITTH
jgi:hypothetical protein